MDAVAEFAREVAPLYKFNNWLGLGSATLDEAEARVENLARDLFCDVLGEFAGGDEHGFISSGRIIVHYWPYTDEPNEITLGLQVRTLIPHGGGFIDLFDERFDNE